MEKKRKHFSAPGIRVLKVLVIWILHQQPLHGYGIYKKIKELSTGMWEPNSGSIYTVLRRLEGEGDVSSEWNREEGKRDRRVYHLTKEGIETLKNGLELVKKRIPLLHRMATYYDTHFNKAEGE